ncbi:Formate/glycerate dehydrogenase catalytic domain-like protein [Caulochytrium protostelioides]|uniref:Formate/glycerate dehydrogenase catalytic domain-like protein n=1 Tax=Caulochytrium protostelioides TaxID=1555241 RepID=A0A4P9WX49_9FUNG|nr:Formate/glycerate dehydrogenase catalytic domain-like protein [Caulochytrium protostelioides]
MIANDGRLGRSPLGAVGAIRDLTIGIRREDKNRWERRAPLTPDHVDTLLKTCPDLRVLVEPSTRRVFDDAAYTAVGAELVPDLRAADAVLGVKEVPAAQLLRNKTYCFFSHTRKGQPYNMPLLRAVLDKQVRLVDYELMTDAESGKRLVQFSGFAGSAGSWTE